jgi:hypothetical protein
VTGSGLDSWSCRTTAAGGLAGTHHCGPQAATVTGPLGQASTENKKAHEIYRKGGRSKAAVAKAFDDAEASVLRYLREALKNVAM